MPIDGRLKHGLETCASGKPAHTVAPAVVRCTAHDERPLREHLPLRAGILRSVQRLLPALGPLLLAACSAAVPSLNGTPTPNWSLSAAPSPIGSAAVRLMCFGSPT
jgi:hypothetical protein